MKEVIKIVALAAIGLSPVLAGAADAPSGTSAANQAPSAAPDTSANPAYGAPAAQNPMGNPTDAKPLADNWTKVKGTVQSADKAANQVKLQDDKGNLSLVNVDKTTVIKKDGKEVAIGDLQNGDRIIITRRKTAPSNNPS